MKDISYCAIAAFLPKELATEVAKASDNLFNRLNTWYVLDVDLFPPHMTMWIAYVPTKNIDALTEAATHIVKGFKPISVNVGNTDFESSGFISIEVENSDELKTLHLTLIDELNAHREDYLSPKYAQSLEKYSPEQQESLIKYGTRKAGNLFQPHISVGMVKPNQVSIAKHIVPATFNVDSFLVNELILFRQGEPGRSIEILKRLTLSHE